MIKSRRTSAMARRRRALTSKEPPLREGAARAWVREGDLDGGRRASRPLTTAEREELTQLRKRVKALERERDMLQEATAFFATLTVKSSDKWRRRRPSIP